MSLEGIDRNRPDQIKSKKRLRVSTQSVKVTTLNLLQIGTEVMGSCQNVDGTPSLNKCLFSYNIHGGVVSLSSSSKMEELWLGAYCAFLG